MTTKSSENSPRYWARLLLLMLLVIPFLPELLISLAAVLASLMGCQPDQKQACLIGSLAVSDVINLGLWAGAGARLSASIVSLPAFYLSIIGWLVLCYTALVLGWMRTSSRLLLGSAVALVFALLPYVWPWLAIANLAIKGSCDLNAAGPCKIFGGKVTEAYTAVGVTAPELLYGGVLAIGVFIIYAIAVAVAGAVSSRRLARRSSESA